MEGRRQWARRVLEVFLHRMHMSLSESSVYLGFLERLTFVRVLSVGE